jgi:hypothetical protein
VLGGATSLDLTAIANTAITGIEYIDIGGGGTATSLTMAIDDVRALSASADSHLLALVAVAPGAALARPTDGIVVGGDDGDVLRLVTGVGGAWQARAATLLADGGLFTLCDYRVKGVVQGTVVVDSDINVII